MIYKMEEKMETEKCITYDQLNIIIAFQKLWFKIAIWFRAYIRASVYNTPDLKSITTILYNIPTEVYYIFSIFYGTEIAQNMKNLFSDFINAGMGLVESSKYGDIVLPSSRTIEWYKTADKISSYFASINVHWDENQWKYLLYQYIKIKADEINAVVKGDYVSEIKLYDDISNINFLLVSYLARGVISSNS